MRYGATVPTVFEMIKPPFASRLRCNGLMPFPMHQNPDGMSDDTRSFVDGLVLLRCHKKRPGSYQLGPLSVPVSPTSHFPKTIASMMLTKKTDRGWNVGAEA